MNLAKYSTVGLLVCMLAMPCECLFRGVSVSASVSVCLCVCVSVSVQDGVLVQPNLYDGVNLYCVFDGHGDYGAIVRALSVLPSSLCTSTDGHLN